MAYIPTYITLVTLLYGFWAVEQKRGVIGLEWEIPLRLLLCMTTRAKVAGAGAINKDPT